ncbi:MAG: 4'-phosphopantetheinyl transferase superfamily protein [Candidatus Pseudoruminococcus sp.]|nr:4'-phosphopantetheinyl transferase superfamily protein [Ruminococcus sp.]MDY2782094.1 4'-phosphopantetheinyl transferase superfamily protein [Candidatus Pseudoruminococcus sp.]
MLNVKLVFVDTSCEFSRYEKYLSFLPNERLEKISRFRFDKDKILSLFSGLLICTEASKQTGIKSNEIQFEYNEHGKPSIKNFPEFHFSVSHSGNCVAFVSDTSPIGIDTEIISDARIEIAKRFFSENEYKYILESKNQNNTFYEIWTKKEAYVKLIGTGLSTPLSSFDVNDEKFSKHFYTKQISEYMLSIFSETKNLSENNIKIEISNY